MAGRRCASAAEDSRRRAIRSTACYRRASGRDPHALGVLWSKRATRNVIFPAVTRAWLLLAVSVLAPGLVAQTAQQPADGRAIDWKKVIPAVASDQKRIWTFPLQPARGKHWAPVLAIAGVTGAMIAADPHEMPYFRRTGTYQDFNHVFSGRATHWGTLIAPVSLYAAGLIRKDSYLQKTALLAGVAVADTAILTVVMKGATSRLRPRDVPAGGDFGDTWFQSKGSNWLRGHGSFPSGHTIAAFSVATVISRRYPKHRAGCLTWPTDWLAWWDSRGSRCPRTSRPRCSRAPRWATRSAATRYCGEGDCALAGERVAVLGPVDHQPGARDGRGPVGFLRPLGRAPASNFRARLLVDRGAVHAARRQRNRCVPTGPHGRVPQCGECEQSAGHIEHFVWSGAGASACQAYGTEIALSTRAPGPAWHTRLASGGTGSSLASGNLPAPAGRGILQQSEHFRWLTRDSLETGGPLGKRADLLVSLAGQWGIADRPTSQRRRGPGEPDALRPGARPDSAERP